MIEPGNCYYTSSTGYQRFDSKWQDEGVRILKTYIRDRDYGRARYRGTGKSLISFSQLLQPTQSPRNRS